MTQQQACSEYIRLLKRHEPEISPELLAIARESFNEGWLQRELQSATTKTTASKFTS